MEDKKSLLSIIIPVYNVRDYLKKTIDCILEQTYSEWELLLIDDGSTDGSVEIAQEYERKDSRIRSIIRELEPKGAPVCRNIGLKEAKGDYVIYLDSDDIIAPYCFQQRIDYIKSNPCDFAVFPLVGFHRNLFDAEGMIFGYKPQGDVVVSLLRRTLPFVVVSNIYKKDALISKDIYWDTTFKSYQDSDYNLQAIKAGLTYHISNLLPDYFYRLSAQNSICKKLSTANNCFSQILFLEKQTEIYKNTYATALMICTAQIYQNILVAKDNGDVVDKFLELGLFDRKKLLRVKLRAIAHFTARISNYKIIVLIQSLIIPVFFWRFKICYLMWGKRCGVLYNEINRFYNERVDDSIKRAINEKI